MNTLLPTDIEKRSFDIIDETLLQKGYAPREHLIVRRIVHATADFDFADSMRLHPNAVDQGIVAIRAGQPVICDARMLQAGLTRLAGRVLCAIDDDDVRQTAKTNSTTRAATAMEKLSKHFDGAIIAIGNAPTALFKVLELVKTKGVKPALIVGIPVGFVGAAESKEALVESGLCYITNVGPRGGSPIVAAAVNAVTLLAESNEQESS